VKDFRTYTIIILRQDKSLRDHVAARRIGWAPCGVGAARWAWDETGQLRQRLRLGVHAKSPTRRNDRSHVRDLEGQERPGGTGRAGRRSAYYPFHADGDGPRPKPTTPRAPPRKSQTVDQDRRAGHRNRHHHGRLRAASSGVDGVVDRRIALAQARSPRLSIGRPVALAVSRPAMSSSRPVASRCLLSGPMTRAGRNWGPPGQPWPPPLTR
jgi:hypothetical protein